MLTGDDLLGDDGDASGQEGAANPMFDAIEIHNLDPFAFSDAKEAQAAKRPKLSDAIASAVSAGNCAAGAAIGANPEEIDIGSDSD